jgi:hypothetical protein
MPTATDPSTSEVSGDHRPFGLPALKTALVVGTVLTLINHPDLLRVPLTLRVVAQCLLNFMVPYLVAGYSRQTLLSRIAAGPSE